MAKVLMIGIDALDELLISKFEDELPSFRKLKEESPDITSTSVYPPDTPTAWASIYTGLNPARHGIIFFVDPLDRVSVVAYQDIDNSPVKGRTFWDFASKMGKKVCVLVPELGYPPWAVNGIMIARSKQRYGNTTPVQSLPTSLSEEFDLLPLASIKTTYQKELLPRYVEAYRQLVINEAEFGLKMLKYAEWDLFFIYSSALDWLGHNLWSNFDESDPAYPGPNPYQNVIRDFYRLYDEMVGRFIAAADSETAIILFSDHGFGMRPVKLLNVNEILRRRGLLVPKMKGTSYRDPYYLFELLKGRITDFANKHGVGETMMKVMHYFPASKKIFTSPISINWQKTQAFVSDLSGIKAYSYGGIIIRKEALGMDYEELRLQLIDEISRMRDENGEPVVKWICRREDLYRGDFISKYPDVIFLLREDYGAGWAIYEPILSNCRTHNIQPGCHRIDTPVFLIANLGSKELPRKEITLMDIAPTVLDLLGIKGDFNFDGRSILQDE